MPTDQSGPEPLDEGEWVMFIQGRIDATEQNSRALYNGLLAGLGVMVVSIGLLLSFIESGYSRYDLGAMASLWLLISLILILMTTFFRNPSLERTMVAMNEEELGQVARLVSPVTVVLGVIYLSGMGMALLLVGDFSNVGVQDSPAIILIFFAELLGLSFIKISLTGRFKKARKEIAGKESKSTTKPLTSERLNLGRIFLQVAVVIIILLAAFNLWGNLIKPNIGIKSLLNVVGAGYILLLSLAGVYISLSRLYSLAKSRFQFKRLLRDALAYQMPASQLRQRYLDMLGPETVLERVMEDLSEGNDSKR